MADLTMIEMVQYGGAAALLYILLKLILDFLMVWKKSDNTPKDPGLNLEQWHKFEEQFKEHHLEDKRLLETILDLEKTIKNQTNTYTTISVHLEVQADALKEMLYELREIRRYKNPGS